SGEWMKKLFEGRNSKERSQFIKEIGRRYYDLLVKKDLSMSYPGHSGFSLSSDELEENNEVKQFLEKAVDYGDLYDVKHTSKSGGQKRIKYYLTPIFCPHFRITYKRIKEPEYLSIQKMKSLFHIGDKVNFAEAKSGRKKVSDAQQVLFKKDNF
ncbi:MAG: hypothetical protein OXF42_05985, partial [Candidatus Dadabacteria bacterium]|nr:hypothetical protein [Candidatus Dadabacteria bacterium]